MMQTYRYASDLQVDVGGIPSGNYSVYVWTFEDSSTLNATLSVNSQVVLPSYDTGAAGHWDKLGPYPATVVNGHIVVHFVCNAPSGDQDIIAGIEIWKAASASVSPPVTPTFSVTSSGQVIEGSDATFTISTGVALAQPVTVGYSMSGKARRGLDYTLDGIIGQITIPAGQSSATVLLQSLADQTKEKNETAIMTLKGGVGYKIVKRAHASVTIVNAP
jgi:hypothetical protein